MRTLKTACFTVLAAFDGDPRAAICALLVANQFLMDELERMRENVSVGYVRQRTNADRR